MIGTPRREDNFEDRAHNFAAHADKLATTAQTIAQSGGCNDRRTVEDIHSAAQQVGRLASRVPILPRKFLNFCCKISRTWKAEILVKGLGKSWN